MSETKIEFNAHYQYVWLKNIGTGDCYVSDHPNIVAEADGVSYLPVGEATMLTMQNNDVYVLGDTVVEAHAQNFPESPFAGGEGGGSDAKLGEKTIFEDGTYYASDDNLDGYSKVVTAYPPSIHTTPLTVTENGTYTAHDNEAYTPVTVNVEPTLERVLLYGAEDYSEPTVVNTTYNWNDNLSNYDSIGVVSSNPTDLADGIIFNHFFDVSTILRAGIQPLVCQYYQRLIGFTATDTTFTITASSSGQESAIYAPAIYKIYGYKGG